MQPRGPGHKQVSRPTWMRWVLVGITFSVVFIVFSVIQQSSGTSEVKSTEMPTQSFNFQWNQSPEMTIESSRSYIATIRTETGDIVIRLFTEESPVTVNNFVFLAKQGYYDGVTFHRVISGFMAQSGDRTGTGSGGPGYSFEDEVNNGLNFDREGLLAMANSGPNTNGSQFFITYEATPHLNGLHTIFGEVMEGMDIVLSLRPRDPHSDQDPGSLIDTILVDEL